jgi:uncharacterized membrane protein
MENARFWQQTIRQGDMDMAKKQLVLAFFANEEAAEAAVKALKSWDKASKDVKLGNIGILAKDKKGKVKTQKLQRKTKGGAVLGAVAAVLTGGASVAAGAVAGGIVGAFFKKGLGMSKEDLARIEKELDGGKAGVGVLAEAAEAAGVSAKLAELGGKPEIHEVTDEAVEEAVAAVEAAPEEPAA